MCSVFFFFSSRRRHTRCSRDWSSDVCSSDLEPALVGRFDSVQTLRILTNLLANAAQHTPGESPIELSVHREGETLVFAVADRGPGIPLPERERIFEPFYRPAGAAADAGGAGLGL